MTHLLSEEDAAALDPKQQRAVIALMTAETHEIAASAAGVSVRTLRRWLVQPAFTRALRALQHQAMDAATRQLQAAAGEAVQALRSVLRDPDAPHTARVSAAKVMLDVGYRERQLSKLAEGGDSRAAGLTIERLFELMQTGSVQ